MDPEPCWHFAIDRGGTFTDVVARNPQGALRTAKLLSEDPGHYDDAAVEAIRRLTGVRTGPLPPMHIRIGTTIATNALLERRGAATLLAITSGFGDALTIGYQDRPDIFARAISRPPPLAAQVLEIDERVSVDGQVLRPLDLADAGRGMRAAFDSGIRSIAIVLMHGWRHGAHEAALAELAEEIGFTQISVSHKTAPLIRLVARADTTLVDACLSPALGRYTAGLRAALGEEQRLLFMQSSGGLVAGDAFGGKDALLSGPAGGIVGMVAAAQAAGFDRVIGFDMGGTSTDVSLYAGEYERRDETVIGGVRVAVPMLRIDTVAAGGGSICRFDGGRFVVGPQSAGAVPGPACYRRGGPLTVTDCNLILGKIRADSFPAVFGDQGDAPLDLAAATARLDAVIDSVAAATGTRPAREAVAEGLVAIAVANMAQAIKAVSVARGADPAEFVLVCFGGAAGQHACLVADALGVERVLLHPLAGVLSAYGIALADRRVARVATIGLPVEDGAGITGAYDRLARDARAALMAQGVAGQNISTEASAQLRYARSDQGIDVAFAAGPVMRAAFEAAYRQRFGFAGADGVVVERLMVEAVVKSAAEGFAAPPASDDAAAPRLVEAYMAGAMHRAPLLARARLAPGGRVEGPALVRDDTSMIVLEPGWSGDIRADGGLLLRRTGPRTGDVAGTAIDPVRLAIFAGLFMGIAEEMGAALQRSAASVNIRERLDYSCALFDAEGRLVANAPHIPVHLGSMGDSVRAIIASRSADGRGMVPGDVYATNDPYRGGTHLPDITVIQPVFAGGERPAFYVAARGHHADIGGIAPGSMPADSRSIDEEGVVLSDVLVVEGGALREAELRALLAGGRWPARNIAQNIADLAAQVAACARGAAGLMQLVDERGADSVTAYMTHVQTHAEQCARALISGLADGAFAVETDEGAVVRVAVRVDAGAGGLTVDFTGTSEQRPGNTNTPLSVVRAAVLYVLRVLVGEDVPLNDGFLRPVTLVVPAGSMLNPHYPAAIVAGNVETSQVITDAMFGALGAMAASQGTMNNFTFGDDALQYYETIAGGTGAGPGFAGASAVQSHMTNSRLTDPEVLEARYPVVVDSFAIRRGSGGAGEWSGGDGVVRRLRFNQPMRANILSNNRQVAPFGLAGGAGGAPGANRVEREGGAVECLTATAAFALTAGDVVVIETPGGGGYGDAGWEQR